MSGPIVTLPPPPATATYTVDARTDAQRLRDLEWRLQVQGEHITRLDIALDEAITEIRRLRYQLRTGQTPDAAMAALEAECTPS